GQRASAVRIHVVALPGEGDLLPAEARLIADHGAGAALALQAVAHGDARWFALNSENRAPHSSSPAFRNPSAKVARSSGRRIGSQSARLETRSVGSSSRRCFIARCALSGRPASAWLAAMTLTTIRKLGNSRKAFSA